MSDTFLYSYEHRTVSANVEVSRARVCRVKSVGGAGFMRHILDEMNKYIIVKSFSYLYNNYKYKW